MATLKAALQEACYMELEGLPSEEILSTNEDITFSENFERKMKKLIRRADHPIRHRIVQAAARLLLAALLSVCSVLAFVPEARAAFVGWVRELYEGWFVYHYTGETQDAPTVVYCPTWVPDGYELTMEPKSGSHMIAVYENPEGDTIIFNCYINTESINLQIDFTRTTLFDTHVGDIPADLYIDHTSGNANHLVWEDGNRQMLFWIVSTLDGETMVKIAESVEEYAPPEPEVVYCPTWVPDGYELTTEPEAGPRQIALYDNPEGDLLLFFSIRDTESSSGPLFIEDNGVHPLDVYVGNLPADLYLDPQEGNRNVLVWQDVNAQLLFGVASTLDGETMVKIAESVEVVQ